MQAGQRAAETMKSQRTRLDRFISEREGVSRRAVRLLLAQGRVVVDGERACSINQVVGQFTRVTLDECVLQDNQAHYVMLHKPEGVVSATRDVAHRTVVDLLPLPYAHTLHIAGRLDFNSSGLLLLTNDGYWSRALSQPGTNLGKTYLVRVEKPLTSHYVEAFSAGMYFSYEGLTTKPAELKIHSEFECQVRLTEGRYHQIKRMFGQFDNRVLSIHRSAVGNLYLDSDLPAGASRHITGRELDELGIDHHCSAD